MKTPPLALLFLNFFFSFLSHFLQIFLQIGIIANCLCLESHNAEMIWGLCLGGVDISGPLASSIWF